MSSTHRSLPSRYEASSTPAFTASGVSTLCQSTTGVSVPEAMAAHTLKASRATASSMATTCTSVLTNGPLARYCRMVIRLEAGAVAEPMAPSSSENARDR